MEARARKVLVKYQVKILEDPACLSKNSTGKKHVFAPTGPKKGKTKLKKWKIKTEYKVLETTEGTSAAIIAALRHFYQDKDAENLEITLLSVNTADNIPEWKGLGWMVVR